MARRRSATTPSPCACFSHPCGPSSLTRATRASLWQINNFDQPCSLLKKPSCGHGLQVVADINEKGVSGPNRIGGLDEGSPESWTSYCLWAVSDGTFNGTGLVWSKRCWSGGPAPSVQQRYPYYMYLIAQHTGGGCPGPDCSFIFQLIKVDSVSCECCKACSTSSLDRFADLQSMSISDFAGSTYTPHALRLPRPIYGMSAPTAV